MACTYTGCGVPAGPARQLPHVPEAEPGGTRPIVLVLPGTDPTALLAGNARWAALSEVALSLTAPLAHPQPRALAPAFTAAAGRAARDLVAPLEGVEIVLASADAPPANASALVLVEILDDETIRALCGSTACTDAIFDLDRLEIHRAIIRLPVSLLDREPDDFANFLAHELGHALGYGEHLLEMDDLAPGEPWFWDRLMTTPIRLGQRWQPVTTEDIFAIAGGRYRLRPGWMEGRHPRFLEAPPYERRLATRDF